MQKIQQNYLRKIQKIPQKLKTLAIRRCFGREIHLFAQEDPAGKTQPGEKLGRGWRSKNFIIVFSWVQILPRAIILRSDYLQFVQRFILFNRISFRYKVLKGIRDDTHAYSTLYQWKKTVVLKQKWKYHVEMDEYNQRGMRCDSATLCFLSRCIAFISNRSGTKHFIGNPLPAVKASVIIFFQREFVCS